MLKITIPGMEGQEQWDSEKEEFVQTDSVREQHLQLEHSLISISKWESKWCKPFLKSKKTSEEILDYIKCMTLNQDVNPKVYENLSSENIKAINDYIAAPMSATYFMDEKSGGVNRETITSEVIYYWMIALNIPFECQKWHLNRLLTLIRVCNIKNGSQKKMSKSEIMRRNAALNEKRKKQWNTKG
jgi:hypothetical protein